MVLIAVLRRGMIINKWAYDIGSLPMTIGSLTKLASLVFYGNRFSGISVHYKYFAYKVFMLL